MVLLIVDTQKMLVTGELYGSDLFVSHIKQLLSAARRSGVEVIFVRHEDGVELAKGTDGFEIFDGFRPMNGEQIIDKHFNSAFKNTCLAEYLRGQNENMVMIAGLQTEYCIDATIKCGFEHGYTMIVPANCNSTFDNVYMTGEQSYNYYNEGIWNKRYAQCVNFEQALELLAAQRCG